MSHCCGHDNVGGEFLPSRYVVTSTNSIRLPVSVPQHDHSVVEVDFRATHYAVDDTLLARHEEMMVLELGCDDHVVPTKEPAGALHTPAVLQLRVHSECATGHILRSQLCDCRWQWEESLRRIVAGGRGVLVYVIGHEGRGIGLAAKMEAYAIMQEDAGVDTFAANLLLNLPSDARSYHLVEHVLHNVVGVRDAVLLTNSPQKAAAFERIAPQSYSLRDSAPPMSALRYLNAKGIAPSQLAECVYSQYDKVIAEGNAPRGHHHHQQEAPSPVRGHPVVVLSLASDETDVEAAALSALVVGALVEHARGVIPVWNTSVADIVSFVDKLAKMKDGPVSAVYVIGRRPRGKHGDAVRMADLCARHRSRPFIIVNDIFADDTFPRSGGEQLSEALVRHVHTNVNCLVGQLEALQMIKNIYERSV